MGKTNTNTKPESKSNRKFEKKVQFYSKVKDAVSSLSAQKSITKKKSRQQKRQNKKLKAYNLSSLLDTLPEFEASQASQKPGPQDNFKLTCKSRKKILLEEEERLSKIRNHPDFQSDPISAVRQHLLCTQPVVEEQPKPKIKVNKNGSKKKKKKSKASTGVQSMDISIFLCIMANVIANSSRL